ncbi:MAG: 4Fe-4S binding protein [Desulfobacteraceae bacterium]|nr:4Fe-4S binding protein [Desulfobacteraceae bacterium]
MTDQTHIDQKYKSAAQAISMAGGTPLPVNDTLIKLLHYYIEEDELDFVIAFKGRKSQTLAQLKESTGLSEEQILAKVKALAGRGVIFNQPNSAGIMVYRLLPLINVGMFEYTFMGKLEQNERNRQISTLFHQLFEELTVMVQQNYDNLVPFLLKGPPVDRTVPVVENKPTGQRITIKVNKTMEAPLERIVPTQEVDALIDKFDEIAVGHCFCRHHKDLFGTPCRQTAERENCFTFGKSARYTSEQGFARMVSKEEARVILKKAEEEGLVHKAYHPNFDILKDETSVCNCCRCCCGNAVENMVAPIINATNFLAVIDAERCTGCGTCVEKCHTGAAFLNDAGKAERIEAQCIGCGVCAYFCPENAVSLVEGQRIVRIAPQRAK